MNITTNKSSIDVTGTHSNIHEHDEMRPVCIAEAYLHANDWRKKATYSSHILSVRCIDTSIENTYEWICSEQIATPTQLLPTRLGCNRYYMDAGEYVQRQQPHSISISWPKYALSSGVCAPLNISAANTCDYSEWQTSADATEGGGITYIWMYAWIVETLSLRK